MQETKQSVCAVAWYLMLSLAKKKKSSVPIDAGLSIGESIMENREFINEFEYQETKRILKDLLEKKIINKSEFDEMLAKFKTKYEPAFDIIT